MTDLHERFRSADRISVPDLWGSILRRPPAAPPPSPPGRRNLAGVVAVIVGGLLVVLLVRLLPLGEAKPTARPTPTVLSPAPTSSASPTPSPGPAPGLPMAVRVVGTLPIETSVMFAYDGQLFAVTDPRQDSLLITRIGRGSMTESAPIHTSISSSYFGRIAVGRHGLYLGSTVIRKFSKASDQLLRIDRVTLRVTAEVPLQAGVDGIVAWGDDLWVATGDRVIRMDPVSLSIRASHVFSGLQTPPLGSESISSPAVTEEGLWVLVGSRTTLRLVRLDRRSLVALAATNLAQLERQELFHIAAAPHGSRIRWVWLIGSDLVQKVNPLTGELEGSPIHMGGIRDGQPYGGGLVAMVTGGTDPTRAGSIIQINGQGEVVAETDGLGDISNLTVDQASESDVWMLQGLHILHARLVGPPPDCLCG